MCCYFDATDHAATHTLVPIMGIWIEWEWSEWEWSERREGGVIGIRWRKRKSRK